MAKQENKNAKVKRLLIAFIAVMLIILIAIVASPSDSSGSGETETTTQNSTVNLSRVIYEDNTIKASYIKVYDDSFIDGAVYLQLLVENKCDKNIMVTLSEAALNNMSTTIGSGTPMVIAPDNSSQQPFIIFTGNTNVNQASDISNLEFKFLVFDNDSMATLTESSTIEISL